MVARRIVISVSVVLCVFGAAQGLRAIERPPLIETTWGQRGLYAAFSPNQVRAGCWSTALAQIAYYHRKRPFGYVRYTTRSGLHFDVNLSASSVDWNHMVPKLTSATATVSRNAVARFVFNAALVVQKDFGTASYCLSHSERALAIAAHYRLATRWVTHGNHPRSLLKATVIHEINAKRPLLIHMRNRARTSYHAAVIDGYRWQPGKLQIHVNLGHGGGDDGWFPFAGPIHKYDDPNYRKLLVIRPLP